MIVTTTPTVREAHRRREVALRDLLMALRDACESLNELDLIEEPPADNHADAIHTIERIGGVLQLARECLESNFSIGDRASNP